MAAVRNRLNTLYCLPPRSVQAFIWATCPQRYLILQPLIAHNWKDAAVTKDILYIFVMVITNNHTDCSEDFQWIPPSILRGETQINPVQMQFTYWFQGQERQVCWLFTICCQAILPLSSEGSHSQGMFHDFWVSSVSVNHYRENGGQEGDGIFISSHSLDSLTPVGHSPMVHFPFQA